MTIHIALIRGVACDEIELDVRQNRNPELRPNLSTDGERLNIQIEEQPRPETRFRLREDGVEIRQEQPEPRGRLTPTVPLANEQ